MLAFLPLAGCLIAARSDAAARSTRPRTRDAKSARSLLAQHVDVNAAEADGSTALHWAAQRDNLEIVNLLIAAGANVKAATRYNITPLSLACTNGNAAIIERLLEGRSRPQQHLRRRPDRADDRGAHRQGGRHQGAARPRRQRERRGALQGPDRADVGRIGRQCGRGRDADRVRRRRARRNPKADSRRLLFAVRNAHIDAAKVLLEHGANVNDVAPDGTSALNMAVVNAYFELASVLLDHGANPNAPDPRGSALHTLAWLRKPGADGAAAVGNTPKGPPVPTGNVTALELAKKLLEHGANPNVRIAWKETRFDKEGGTTRNPPHIHLGRHYLSYVGATPFYVAAHNGDAPLHAAAGRRTAPIRRSRPRPASRR